MNQKYKIITRDNLDLTKNINVESNVKNQLISVCYSYMLISMKMVSFIYSIISENLTNWKILNI